MSEVGCDHGITLSAYVEVCAECHVEVVHRPSEEAQLRGELARAEAVLVAADRIHAAYDALLEGRDVGRLGNWSGGSMMADSQGEGDE